MWTAQVLFQPSQGPIAYHLELHLTAQKEQNSPQHSQRFFCPPVGSASSFALYKKERQTNQLSKASILLLCQLPPEDVWCWKEYNQALSICTWKRSGTKAPILASLRKHTVQVKHKQNRPEKGTPSNEDCGVTRVHFSANFWVQVALLRSGNNDTSTRDSSQHKIGQQEQVVPRDGVLMLGRV